VEGEWCGKICVDSDASNSNSEKYCFCKESFAEGVNLIKAETLQEAITEVHIYEAAFDEKTWNINQTRHFVYFRTQNYHLSIEKN